MKLLPILAAAAGPLVLLACSHAQPAASSPNEATMHTTSALVAAPPQSAPRPLYAPEVALTTTPGIVAPMNAWSSRYPDAANELGRWVGTHPQASRELAAWQEANPERMRVLVDWAVTQRYESFGAFRFNRAGWDGLQRIADEDPAAFDSFLTWIRHAPPAAIELSRHPEALAYVDHRATDYAQIDSSEEQSQRRARAQTTAGPPVFVGTTSLTRETTSNGAPSTTPR